MQPRKAREKEILSAALACATLAEGMARVEDLCPADAQLRRRVLRSLERHWTEETRLDSRTAAALADDRPVLASGTAIGCFVVKKRLGEGGFADVYLAEQTKPLRRDIALKVLKLGMDSIEVIARFEAERQALALMDHPNVAQVFAAGTTPEGRPYVAMEYVPGLPITEFCDSRQLEIGERLRLFTQVCDGVQHAHQKGIIHRDLKPTNVLVTEAGGHPLPKVIDFGVAKATHGHLTEKTLFTHYGELIGTPAFMSPEQADLGATDIDTRSDVYALGALLYHLLTGAPPFDPRRLRAAAYNELLRIIREEDPPKPSTQLSSGVAKQPEIAARRRMELPRLIRMLHGDLDWIVMKSLEKDRSRRYKTATALAYDIERHLRHQPVEAGPPGTLYRGRKFVRRHRVGVLASGAVMAALLLGLWASTEGFLAANRQRHMVEQERAAARRSLYSSHMLLARQDWERRRVRRLWDLLDAQRPHANHADLRGWEWYYLHGLLRQDLHTLRGHTGPVLSVDWSPNGRHVVSAGEDQAVRVWAGATGELVAVLFDHRASVNVVAWSPDGKYWASGSDDETIRIWDGHRRQVLRVLGGHRGSVRAIAWSPDGRRLASGGEDAAVRLWDAATGTESGSLSCAPRSETVLSLAWSPDGRWLIAGLASAPDNHERGICWELSTREARHLMVPSGSGYVRSVSWRPDSLVAAWGAGSRSIRFWDPATGEQTSNIMDEGGIRSIVWSPDARLLVSARDDHTAGIFDVDAEKEVTTLMGHRGAVRCAAWRHDGRQLATGSTDGTVKLWDATRTEEALIARRHENWVSSVSWSPDGKRLASACLRPEVLIWDPPTGEELIRLTGHRNRVWCVDWSPDGERLATTGMDQSVRIWDATDGSAIRTMQGHFRSAFFVAWSPQGDTLASAGWNPDLLIWSASTGEVVLRLPRGHPTDKHMIAWSPDGAYLASKIPPGKEIGFWDTTTGERCGTLPSRPTLSRPLAWCPDGRRLAAGCDDGSIQVWEVDQGTQVFSARAHAGVVTALAWSPDGRRLASGSFGEIRICDADTGEETLLVPGHEATAWSLAWSPDGRRLASGGFDSMARIWDASTGFDLEHESEALTNPLRALQEAIPGLSDLSPEQYQRTVVDVGTHVMAALQRGLMQEDISLAASMARGLESAIDPALPGDTYHWFAGLLDQCKEQELAVHAGRLRGLARRLALPGQTTFLSGLTLDEKPVVASHYRGKVVLVICWRTTSGVCLAELNHIRQRYQEYRDRGLEVVGICTDRDRHNLDAWLASDPLPWITVKEATAPDGQDFTDYYGVTSVPTAFLIGTNGSVLSIRAHGPKLDALLEQTIGPPHAPKGELTQIDLSAMANGKLTQNFGGGAPDNTLADLPRGRHVHGGVPLLITDRVIQLEGRELPARPSRIDGIRVHRTFGKIYFLHGTGKGRNINDGTLIGQYFVNYIDQPQQAIPIVYGEDVRDYWDCDDSKAVTRSFVTWTGANPASRRYGETLRLYLSCWQNPHPHTMITSIDYMSSVTRAAPFCVAIAGEAPVDAEATTDARPPGSVPGRDPAPGF